MSKPRYAATPDTALRGLRRDTETLKRRAAGFWVYAGLVIPGGDPAGRLGDLSGFQNGWADTGDGTSTTDQLTRYRIALGGGFECQINVTGGTPGEIVFTLLIGYWDPTDGKQTFAAVDDSGSPTCYTIVPNGTSPDVWQGRV